MPVKFRVELVWEGDDREAASSIYLTGDGRVILQGRGISAQERAAMSLPAEARYDQRRPQPDPCDQGHAVGI